MACRLTLSGLATAIKGRGNQRPVYPLVIPSGWEELRFVDFHNYCSEQRVGPLGYRDPTPLLVGLMG